jgi:hypothetical protein
MEYNYITFVLYAGKPMTVRFTSIKSLTKDERAFETEKVLEKKIGTNFNKSKITYLKL